MKVRVALAARNVDKLATLARETGAETFACDASRRGGVERLFGDVEGRIGAPDVVIYNASGRTRGPFVDLDPAEVERAIAVGAYGGFLVAQQAVKLMQPKGSGAMLFTGASASVKGYAQSAPFAMAKFAFAALRRAWRASLRRKASMSRTSSSMARSAIPADLTARSGRTRCSTRMRSPKAISA